MEEQHQYANWSEFRRRRRIYRAGLAGVALAAAAGLAEAVFGLPLMLMISFPLLFVSVALGLYGAMFLKNWSCPTCSQKFCGEWHQDAGASECRYCGAPMGE
jgi:hypothetical protein